MKKKVIVDIDVGKKRTCGGHCDFWYKWKEDGVCDLFITSLKKKSRCGECLDAERKYQTMNKTYSSIVRGRKHIKKMCENRKDGTSKMVNFKADNCATDEQVAGFFGLGEEKII